MMHFGTPKSSSGLILSKKLSNVIKLIITYYSRFLLDSHYVGESNISLNHMKSFKLKAPFQPIDNPAFPYIFNNKLQIFLDTEHMFAYNNIEIIYNLV